VIIFTPREVQLLPEFSRRSKRAKVKSIIMYGHSVVDYGAATELVNPGGRSPEGFTNAAGLMGGCKGARVLVGGEV
jgi:hypothetical protein